MMKLSDVNCDALGSFDQKAKLCRPLRARSHTRARRCVRDGAAEEAVKAAARLELDARPSDAIALALRTGSSIWMLEEVVADASIPVDAEADAEDQDNFRRFLDSTSPAELVRHLKQSHPEGDQGGEEPGEDEPGSDTPAP